MIDASLRYLERGALVLGLAVIAVLGLNFTVSHDITASTPGRFILSATLLALVAAYFRVGVRPVTDLHRAAYRTALTMAVWSVAYALVPRPESILYLIALPALFFGLRAEHKAKRGAPYEADALAAAVLFAAATLLFFEQAPLQAVLFPNEPFDWRGYFWNAPVLVVTGLGFIRLNRPRHGMVLLGIVCAATGLGLSLTALVAWTAARFGLQAPIDVLAIASGLAVTHLVALLVGGRHGPPPLLREWAGLDETRARQLAHQTLLVALLAAHVAIAYVCWSMQGQPAAAALLLVAVATWLHRARRGGVAIALLEVALLAYFAKMLLYPALDVSVPSVLLTALLVVCVLLKRSLRFRQSMTIATFGPIALLAIIALMDRGFFQPSTLVMLAVIGASWSTLTTLPGPPVLVGWPIALAVVLLCINSGYDSALWAPGALALMAVPLVAVVTLNRLSAAQFWFKRRGSTRLAKFLQKLERSLPHLTWPALIASGLAMGLDASAANWYTLAICLVALAIALGVHVRRAIHERSLVSAVAAEVFLFTMLAIARWQLDTMEALDRGTAVDGYILLGFAFAAAGLREVLRRHSQAFAHLLEISTSVYAGLGLLYMLWLYFSGGGDFHGELGTMLIAGLYWWLSRNQHRGYALTAIAIANIAIVLFCVNLGLTNLQFYVMPVAASILMIAQSFKERLDDAQHRMVRLGCALAMLGTSSFYNIVDFDASYAYPLAAALASALGVVIGIALRVRIYLYLGFSAFAFNALVVLVHVIQNQPPTQTKLLIGVIFLGIGVLFIGSFLAIQVKRQEILTRYRELQAELARWD